MDEKIAAKLREAFKPAEIGKLPRVTCGKCSRGQCDEHSKAKCDVCGAYVSTRHIHLDYVGHADVTSRLIEADPGWNWEPKSEDEHGLPLFDTDAKGAPVGLWVRLTVGGVTRLGYGSCPSGQNDAVKVLIGDCLLRGTPVRTRRGTVRIEDVHIGDQVPTREGWRRVTDHWLSHPSAPTRAVLLANGRVVVGTPHHRVPTANRGLTRIEALRNGDMLYTWQGTANSQVQTRSSGMVAATGGSPIIPTGIVASTSWRPPRRATTCTSTSTRRHTGQSLTAGTSITATLTRLTMTPETSSPSRQKITPSGMASAWSPTSVIVTNVASPMRRYADGAAGVLLLARNAGGAETGLPTFAPARDLSGNPGPAKNAEPSSLPSSLGHAFALAPVVSVLDAGPGEVWNLSVEGTHEYVANGIIVQNSLRNAAMRFGVALDLWAKGDRADPSAENATASGGQAVRRPARQQAGDAWDSATTAKPQNGQRTGNGGQVSRPAQRQQPAQAKDAEPDPDAQPFFDEAHQARTVKALEDVHRRAREAGKLAAFGRNPATGGIGGFGAYANWRKKQLEDEGAALAELEQAAGDMSPLDLDGHVKKVTGADLEAASAAQLREAAKALMEGEPAA